MGEDRGGGGQEVFAPLPFTLLDKVLCFALLSENTLSNGDGKNPLPPGEGEIFLGVFHRYSHEERTPSTMGLRLCKRG